MKLYDSLKKDILAFEPADGKTFRIYACGPTVYKDLTIGNWRTFLTVDLLHRYLEYRGYGVKLVMNLTDVGHILNDADTGEDKIVASAKEQGKTPREIADHYSGLFYQDLKTIAFREDAGVEHPRATAHIKEMVAMIETLLEKGLAYATAKGDVYFDVTKAKTYGRLSGNAPDQLKAGARVEVNEDKRHPGDFALWINNPRHAMQWDGPRGVKGYPGWHIECSAMSMKYLGETLDLHIGGEDLKFPHHECEIAQSEGATGKPFCRHWLHVKYLQVDGEKMSKSKGNYYTLSDLIAKGHAPEAVRYMLLSAHYRTPLNFTLEGLGAAGKAVRQFRELVQVLQTATGKDCKAAETKAAVAEARRAFDASLDDDLNVSGALAAMHELLHAMNRLLAEGSVGAECGAEALAFLKDADDVFGFGLFAVTHLDIPPDVQTLADERAKARAEKRWADSDHLRDAIAEKGFIVEDGTDGQKLKKK